MTINKINTGVLVKSTLEENSMEQCDTDFKMSNTMKLKAVASIKIIY